MPTEMQRRLLRDVRDVLRLSFSGENSLEAFWADADPGRDGEIYFLNSGKRHVVHVQVGVNFASVNVMRYDAASLGHGIVHEAYRSLDQGAPRRPDIDRVGPDLAAALAAHDSTFEPARGPGIALHHGFPALLASAVDVFSDIPGGPYSPVVNAGLDGTSERDVISFVDPEGVTHPVSFAISVRSEAMLYLDGDMQADLRWDPSAGSLTSRLRNAVDDLAASPAP